jgi:hypothetical protein
MSEAVQVAAFLLVAGAIGTIAKLLWGHIEHCKVINAKLASIETKVDRVIQDIGTHETGMRGTVHKTANRLIEHEARLMVLERGKDPVR